MTQETKLAVLIDSDNVSAKYAQFIMQEVTKYGTPTYKRVYGDWEKGGNGWHGAAINYSIMPVQQCCYIAGKNSTDFSMIIDAMDILYTGEVDGFVLVTSDSDFTRLAIRLREAGKLVVGIGELKTPRAFTISCHHFCYLNQVCAPEGAADEATIRKAVVDFVKESNDSRLDLAKISAVLTSRFGNINYDELGYNRFSNFIDSFHELRRQNTFVSLKKQKPERTYRAPRSESAPTAQDIINSMNEYFEKNAPERDNLIKIESYLSDIYGKIDFSLFGSKRFAKFVDKLEGFKREGTTIYPATAAAPEESAATAAEVETVRTETAAETDANPNVGLTKEIFDAEAVAYAQHNMPKGGYTDYFNKNMVNKYGRGFLKEIGMTDLRRALLTVSGINLRGSKVFAADEVDSDGSDNTSDSGITDNSPVIEKAAGHADVPVEKATSAAVSELVLKYAADNMPDGGNIGQLNNLLMARFGKSYAADLGAPDMKTVLSSVADIKVRRNHVYLTDAKYAEFVDSIRTEIQPKEEAPAAAAAAEEPAEEQTSRRRGRPRKEFAGNAETAEASEKSADANAADKAESAENNESGENPDNNLNEEKAEINAVKRDILNYAATSENGTLAQLGNILSHKYGKGYLKEIGFGTIKKLIAEMPGVSVNENNISINEDFAQRTAEIEQFVNNFARSDGSHSIRALGIQLKNNFDGFSYTDYGFARFSDFINAIDGVRCDRYHIHAVE
jgi:uncharacterized LabA/DUF88 family protein